MKILIIDRVISKQEWQDIIDNFWDNTELFLTQTEFPLIEKKIEETLENKTLIKFENKKYILHRHYDMKDVLMGYILLDFESSFSFNKDKECFCEACTSLSLNQSGDVPFGELTRKQLDKIICKEETTYCSNCQRIITYNQDNTKSLTISNSRFKTIK